MEENACAWYNKCRNFKVSGGFPRGQQWNTQTKVIRGDLKEKKLSKDVVHKKPFSPCKHGKEVKVNIMMMMMIINS